MTTTTTPPPRITLGEGETLCFLSHHKAGAKAEALFLHDAICAHFGLRANQVFLDSNELHDLNVLLANHLRKTKVVLLLQTKDVLFRPFVVAEIAHALSNGIPVVPVVIEGSGYDFKETGAFLGASDFAARLEKDNPGATAALERFGVDVVRAGRLLSETLPMLISKKFDSAASERLREAMLNDIFEEIVRVTSSSSSVSSSSSRPSTAPPAGGALSATDAVSILRSSREPSEVKRAADYLISLCGGEKSLESEDWKRELIIKEGANEAAVAVAETVRKNPEELARCLTLIARLARNATNKPKLMSLGAGKVISQTLLEWGEKNARAAEAGCAAARELALNNAENRTAMVGLGIGGGVVAAMKALGGKDKGVAQWGCGAIASLVDDGTNQETLMKLGAGAVVVAVMRAFGAKDAGVAAEGCWAIRNLAFNNKPNHAPLMKLGAGEVVVAAMKAFGSKEVGVAEWGCRAISNLALEPANKVPLVKAGAGTVVLAAMKALGDREPEQAGTMGVGELGCTAINALALECDENMKWFKKAGAVELVTKLKAGRPKDDGLARQVDIALKRLS